jgi:hypothetical protein
MLMMFNPALKGRTIVEDIIIVKSQFVFDNSPAIYGWVHGLAASQVPSGTKEIVCRHCRDLENILGG